MAGVTPGLWREAEHYRPILEGGRPALAWELLRRDGDYRRVFASERPVHGRLVAASPECAPRWGLHFRT
jgi:hypothetical protein